MNSQSESSKSPVVTWAKNNPTAVASLLGGLIYVVVFDNYRTVLRPFGVTPAEVGIGYLDIVWPVVRSVGFLGFVLCLIIALVSSSLKKHATVLRSLNRGAIVLFVLGVGVFILTIITINEMALYGKCVTAGKEYVPYFGDRLQVLSCLRANRVKVVWKESKESRPPLPTSEVLFLGAADGVGIFYSSNPGETLRVPLHDIVLSASSRQR